ncbi:MAG TPA: AI-2E family transporter [Kofleriaceae bacterium]|nr:AI-2E family transporter [Kofleriaceae bacterium]
MTAEDPEPPPGARRTLRIELAPRTIGLLLLVVAGVWLAAQLQTVLIVVTIALVMVGTFDPLVAWFERHRIRRGRALVLIFVALALVVAGILLVTVPPLVAQLLHLIEDAPRGRDKLLEWLRPYKLTRPFVQAIKAVPLNDLVVRAGNTMVGYSSEVLTLVGYMISTTFLAIYLLADPVRTKGLIYAVVPRNHHIKLARILIELKVIVGGYMRGQLITSVVIAVFTFALLSAFRVEDALALALFAGMTDNIPFIGGYVASLPVILAVTGSGTGAVIIVIVLMFAYQEFESRILVPRVYGRVLRLPPAVVLVSLLIGGTLMGIVGALLALPIAAGLQMVVRELRVELPGETPPDAVTRARDEKAEHIYERLSEGATAADAAVIAGELAQKMRQNEITGATLTTSELPAIVADLPGEATEAAVTSSAFRTDGTDAGAAAPAPVTTPAAAPRAAPAPDVTPAAAPRAAPAPDATPAAATRAAPAPDAALPPAGDGAPATAPSSPMPTKDSR